ncbi:MAG: hypothetical protein WD825_00140 [Gemmatimonadaceae bacterium]
MRKHTSSRAATILPSDKRGHRVNAWVDAYTDWVIRNLVGYKGTNPTDVASTLLREWVTANRAELQELGLWPPTIRAGRAVIVPPGA